MILNMPQRKLNPPIIQIDAVVTQLNHHINNDNDNNNNNNKSNNNNDDDGNRNDNDNDNNQHRHHPVISYDACNFN